MTTKVLVVNFGPAPVEVIEMHKSPQSGYPDSPSANAPHWIPPQSQDWFYVHTQAYLVVKEKEA